MAARFRRSSRRGARQRADVAEEHTPTPVAAAPNPTGVVLDGAQPGESSPSPDAATAAQRLLADFVAKRCVDLAGVELRSEAEKFALEAGFERLRCLPLLRGFQPHEYQLRVVRQVLRNMGGRALLADEVGLGKTIEALCILKELDVRGLVRNVLILTPATLVAQWIEELKFKFDLDFHRGRKREHWRAYPRIVASLDTAKSRRHAEEILQVPWGLVIVDEAHRLKNRRTRNFRFVNQLRSQRLLLLSATPFQNNLVELFNLVTLLRPGQLETEAEFKRRYLVRGDKSAVNDTEGLKQLLAAVMVRNRRSEVGVEFVPRRGMTRRLPMSDEHEALHVEAVDFCRRRFREVYGDSAPLVAVGYLRMLCASPFRFRESLVGNILPRLKTAGATHLEPEVRRLVELADAVTWDAKLEALVEDLKRHKEQVVTFTHYRGLLKYVAARLRHEKIDAVPFHGGFDADQKEEAIAAFKSGRRVLLSTDAGNEGRNLQFARRVVNYDLPWNPMKVEQRIGRVHRMGQTREVIVTSYTLQGTIEDDLLQLLERKLGLFQLIVGEVELILGRCQVEKRLASMVLDSRSDEEMRERLGEFGEELQQMRTDYNQVQRLNETALAKVGTADDDAAGD